MDTDISTFWEVLIWSFWVFLWITALVILFHCIVDLLGDATVSGWAKASWAVVMVSIPWFGALIYIVRRRGIGEPQRDLLDSDGIATNESDDLEPTVIR